jgi:hypothetical protein
MQKIIYAFGYPKSGNTYLTRLLADVISSPSGGCMPAEDKREVATEGADRPGAFIVRKGHFLPVDNDAGSVVPQPHRMAVKLLTDERLVFIVRDPRDICVSGAWHWRVSQETFLDRMIRGDVAGLGRWDKYVEQWLTIIADLVANNSIKVAALSYEQLLQEREARMVATLMYLDIPDIPIKHISEAFKRQSFEERAKRIQDAGDSLRRNNMHEGKAGEWVKYFSGKMNDRILSEFGTVMQRIGYKP